MFRQSKNGGGGYEKYPLKFERNMETFNKIENFFFSGGGVKKVKKKLPFELKRY